MNVCRFLLPLLLVILTGCGTLTRGLLAPPEVTAEAREVLDRLSARNQSLNTFKGTGAFVLVQPRGRQSARAAWIGKPPDQLRIGVLNLAGQPALSLATDGTYFYAMNHTDGELRKIRTGDPSLRRIIEIPVRARTVIHLLSGRIPIQPYTGARIIPGEDGPVLLTVNRWGETRQRIYLDQNRTEVRKIEMYGMGGGLLYSVERDDIRTTGEYRLPFSIAISDPTTRFTLDIDRYWADTPVSPAAFVLNAPPEAEGSEG